MLTILFRPKCVNPSSAGTINIQDPNLVITVLTDGLAPNGARPSVSTVLIEKLDRLLPNFSGYKWLCLIIMKWIMSFKTADEISQNLTAPWVLMTREGTCQSLQSRALSLDVDSKQWLYLFYFTNLWSSVLYVSWEHLPFFAYYHKHPRWSLEEWLCSAEILQIES